MGSERDSPYYGHSHSGWGREGLGWKEKQETGQEQKACPVLSGPQYFHPMGLSLPLYCHQECAAGAQ